MASIGQRIRALRKARSLNQTQLAKAVGVDQSTVSDIERGAGFSAELLMSLADALLSTPQFIMRGASEADLEVDQLAALYRASSPDDRRALMSSASAFAERGRANPFPKARAASK